jgi:hypothetical protein
MPKGIFLVGITSVFIIIPANAPPCPNLLRVENGASTTTVRQLASSLSAGATIPIGQCGISVLADAV